VTDRSAVAEIFVRSVTARESGEMMPPDNARVALAARYAFDVDLIAGLEHIARGNRLAERDLALAAALELARALARGDIRLREMAAQRVADARQFLFAERHLHGFIAVGRLGLELAYGAWPERNHAGGADSARAVDYLGHPDLFADKSVKHRPYSSL